MRCASRSLQATRTESVFPFHFSRQQREQEKIEKIQAVSSKSDVQVALDAFAAMQQVPPSTVNLGCHPGEDPGAGRRGSGFIILHKNHSSFQIYTGCTIQKQDMEVLF